MEWMINCLCQAGLCQNLGLDTGASLEEVVQVVRQRIDEIRPLTREVFGLSDLYKVWKNQMGFGTLNRS